MRLQERFLSGVRNDTDQRKIVIRCDKKDDKKNFSEYRNKRKREENIIQKE